MQKPMTRAEFDKLTPAAQQAFTTLGGAVLDNLPRADFESLSADMRMKFITSGGRVADEAPALAEIATAEAGAKLDIPNRQQAILRARFDALSPNEKSAFIMGGGIVVNGDLPVKNGDPLTLRPDSRRVGGRPVLTLAEFEALGQAERQAHLQAAGAVVTDPTDPVRQ